MTSDQLHSWKEVAQYLGCSVRTVQRWEAERGLPVRRIPGQRGAVFALRAEIDQWKVSFPEGWPPNSHSGQESGTDAGMSRARRLSGALALGLVVLTLAGIAVFSMRGPASRAAPVSFALTANALNAYDARGSLAWSHVFASRTRALDLTWRSTIGEWAQRADIDGDGIDEVLVLVGHPTREESGSGTETLYAFSADGTPRWSYAPNLTLDFSGKKSSGPWGFLDYEVIPEHGIWVSVTDHVWWPSAVEEIDHAGRVRTRFYQPGHVRVLKALHEGGRTLVAAAGVNNEWAAASVALLDPTAVATAPQRGDGAFLCQACPSTRPLRYVLLSPSPLTRIVQRPYNTATELLVGPTLIVSTYEAEHANMLFSLTRDLHVISAEPSDGYWSYAVSNQGLLREEQSVEVREWSPQGWSTSRVTFNNVGKAARSLSRPKQY